MIQTIPTRDLDTFVARSDELGGPGHPECDAYWTDTEFSLDVEVDETLNPFSDGYVEQQLSVYRELSGRDLDQLVNEHTDVDVDLHVDAVNPYNHGSPGGLSAHVERLSRALRVADPPRGGKMLDMGCGWGLSAEVAAFAGLSVTAVDVNQSFVDLVNRRAERLGHDVAAHHGTFDDFVSDEQYDLVVFYECLHHALRPWTVLRRMADMLAPGGKVVLAGEPINDTWWRHWGLRLDPMSVYCIRKFGWLESGWSEKFLVRAFRRAGLDAQVHEASDPTVGPVVTAAHRLISTVAARQIASSWTHQGWFDDGDYLVASGACELGVEFPEDARRLHIGMQNFRGRDLHVEVRAGGEVVASKRVPPGRSGIAVARDRVAAGSLTFVSERWSPQVEHGSTDDRQIGFHLEDVAFL